MGIKRQELQSAMTEMSTCEQGEKRGKAEQVPAQVIVCRGQKARGMEALLALRRREKARERRERRETREERREKREEGPASIKKHQHPFTRSTGFLRAPRLERELTGCRIHLSKQPRQTARQNMYMFMPKAPCLTLPYLGKVHRARTAGRLCYQPQVHSHYSHTGPSSAP
jgi:hypothetical protein